MARTIAVTIYVIDPLRCTECVGAEDEPQCTLLRPADCILERVAAVEQRAKVLAQARVDYAK